MKFFDRIRAKAIKLGLKDNNGNPLGEESTELEIARALEDLELGEVEQKAATALDKSTANEGAVAGLTTQVGELGKNMSDMTSILSDLATEVKEMKTAVASQITEETVKKIVTENTSEQLKSIGTQLNEIKAIGVQVEKDDDDGVAKKDKDKAETDADGNTVFKMKTGLSTPLSELRKAVHSR